MKLSVAICATVFMIGCAKPHVMQPVVEQPVCDCQKQDIDEISENSPCWEALKKKANKAAESASDALDNTMDAARDMIHELTEPEEKDEK